MVTISSLLPALEELHTAPATQPARSFSLFKAFLTGKPLPKA